MEDKLQWLEALTKTLPDLSELVAGTSRMGYTEYKTETGTSMGWSLLNIPEVAVQRHFISGGTEFEGHAHPANEWVIVTKGILQFTIDHEQRSTTYVGQCQFLPANCFHSCIAMEDTWIIGIVVPSVEGYPHDSGN